MRNKILLIACLLMLAGSASAWERETYEVAAERLCANFGCTCNVSILDGVNTPDLKFKDTTLHHCYKTGLTYMWGENSSWEKPIINSCPALDKANVWLDAAANDTACGRWHDIGIALHYFLDSKEIWDNVANPNRTCQAEYESEVNDYMRFGGRKWTACSCGECVASDDFVNWLTEFQGMVKPLIPSDRQDKATAAILSNDLDAEAAEKLSNHLRSLNITVLSAGPGNFTLIKNKPLVIVLGGHRAKDVGVLVDSILTDEDKAQINQAVLSGVLIKKTNLWVWDQTVYFIAGYDVNETADAAWSSRDEIVASSDDTVKTPAPAPQCITNADCGTAYMGPWVCSNRKQASRVKYKPYCKAGSCVERAELPSTVGCGYGGVCLPLYGCVSLDRLSHYEGLYTPMFDSWLSTDRLVSIKGGSNKLVLYVKSYRNDTLECQYYDDGWEDMGGVNSTHNAEVLINVSSKSIGKIPLTERIRCGNNTGGADNEFQTMYYAEHNLTLMNIPPPIAFTFTLSPENLTFRDCFERKNTTLKIENLCGHPIDCKYSIGRNITEVMIRSSTERYNVSVKSLNIVKENITGSYLSYYTGADFGNSTTYSIIDEDGNVINKTISQATIDYYARFPKNYTYVNVTVILNVTAEYEWDYPHTSENTFWVNTNECSIPQIPVAVTCTDEYKQYTTLRKTLNLNYPKA